MSQKCSEFCRLVENNPFYDPVLYAQQSVVGDRIHSHFCRPFRNEILEITLLFLHFLPVTCRRGVQEFPPLLFDFLCSPRQVMSPFLCLFMSLLHIQTLNFWEGTVPHPWHFSKPSWNQDNNSISSRARKGKQTSSSSHTALWLSRPSVEHWLGEDRWPQSRPIWQLSPGI